MLHHLVRTPWLVLAGSWPMSRGASQALASGASSGRGPPPMPLPQAIPRCLYAYIFGHQDNDIFGHQNNDIFGHQDNDIFGHQDNGILQLDNN